MADSAEPAAKASREITSIRRLPNMSPSRPMIGVKTAAVTR